MSTAPKQRTTPTTTPQGAAAGAAKVQGPRSYFPSIEKTYGKPINEWMALLSTAGTTKHMELVAWLKDTHGMGHGHANALVAVHLDPSR